MVKLKPCPLCNKDDMLISGFMEEGTFESTHFRKSNDGVGIYCARCRLLLSYDIISEDVSTAYDLKRRLIRKWNTRTKE